MLKTKSINAWLKVVKLLNRFFYVLGLRALPTRWGVVYDSVTKLPVDPVVVKLLHTTTGKVLSTSITNIRGQYGFLAFPGSYKLFIQRAHYQFPSQRITKRVDGTFDNLYFGEPFVITGGSDIISFNIPLDPTEPDWNQEAKRKALVKPARVHFILVLLCRLLFWLGLPLAFLHWYITHSDTAGAIVIGYVLLMCFSLITPRVRMWGHVINTAGTGVPDVTLHICHTAHPDIGLVKTKTETNGKFFARIPQGTYILKLTQLKGDKEITLLEQPVRIGPESLINNTFVI